MQIPFTIKNETVYLTADDNNYSLSRERERTREGVTTTELEAFKWFANLDGALNRLVDLKVKSSDAKSLMELKQALELAREEVTQTWKVTAEAGREDYRRRLRLTPCRLLNDGGLSQRRRTPWQLRRSTAPLKTM